MVFVPEGQPDFSRARRAWDHERIARPSGTIEPILAKVRRYRWNVAKTVLITSKPKSGRTSPNRGFSLGLVRQRHPKFSLGFDHFMPREQDLEIFASRILCLTPMAAHVVVA
jgi:hypothetical protein